MKKITIINLVLFVFTISSIKNAKCDYQFNYNELIKFRIDLINNYLQTNLNELNNYLYKLNDYLSAYPLFEFDQTDQPIEEQSSNNEQSCNVCLRNRTDICWHIEDTINNIDLTTTIELKPLKWFTNYNLTTFTNLNSFNLKSLNLKSLNLNNFNLNKLKLDTLNKFNLNNLNSLNVNRAFFISYFDNYDNEELKNILVSFNLFMPFVCSAFLFLLCIQNQHRRKIIELNQLFRQIECLSGLQQIKEDMKSLANVIDELKLDAKQNHELKIKLQQMLNNEFRLKQQLDMNCNHLKSGDQNNPNNEDKFTNTFTDQINRINQQLKLNQLEQSKLKYMVCKTIESFDRILNKMKNNCELINS